MGVVPAPACPNPWSDYVDEVFGTHMVQSLASLVTVAVVISRAVNILS